MNEGIVLNFKIFKCYINVCRSLGIIPSWGGLERFRVFCLLECEESAGY